MLRPRAEFLVTANPPISGKDVLGYLMRLNGWSKETALQVLTVDGYGSEYSLEDFPLRRLRAGDDYNPVLSREYAERPTPFPPIVLGYDWDWASSRPPQFLPRPRLVIRDGNHRVDAAKRRGDKAIRAYVPRPPKTAALRKRPGLVGPLYHGTSASFDEWRLPEEHGLAEMGIHFGTLPQAEYVIGLDDTGRFMGHAGGVQARGQHPPCLPEGLQAPAHDGRRAVDPPADSAGAILPQADDQGGDEAYLPWGGPPRPEVVPPPAQVDRGQGVRLHRLPQPVGGQGGQLCRLAHGADSARPVLRYYIGTSIIARGGEP